MSELNTKHLDEMMRREFRKGSLVGARAAVQAVVQFFGDLGLTEDFETRLYAFASDLEDVYGASNILRSHYALSQLIEAATETTIPKRPAD